MRLASISGAPSPSAASRASHSEGTGDRTSTRREPPKRRISTSTTSRTNRAGVRSAENSTSNASPTRSAVRTPLGRPEPPRASARSGKASVGVGSIATAMTAPSYSVAAGMSRRSASASTEPPDSIVAYERSKRRDWHARSDAPAARDTRSSNVFVVSSRTASNLSVWMDATILLWLAEAPRHSCV